jgi:hypothetical protein
MFELLEDHTGELPEEMVAAIVVLLPFFRLSSYELKVIVGFSITTSQLFDTPSTVAEMVAVPCLTAVIIPKPSTIATLFLFVFQVGLMPDDTVAESLVV